MKLENLRKDRKERINPSEGQDADDFKSSGLVRACEIKQKNLQVPGMIGVPRLEFRFKATYVLLRAFPASDGDEKNEAGPSFHSFYAHYRSSACCVPEGDRTVFSSGENAEGLHLDDRYPCLSRELPDDDGRHLGELTNRCVRRWAQ